MNIHSLPDDQRFRDILFCKAAAAGLLDEAASLLALGASPDAVSEKGLPALHLAAFHGWNDMLGFLLEKGANPALKTPGEGVFAIHMAAFGGNLNGFRILAQMPPGPHPTDSGGRRPIHFAAMQMPASSAQFSNIAGEDVVSFPPAPDFPAVIRHVLELGETLDAQDFAGKTSLHHLAEEGRLAPFRFLLQMGANPQVPDRDGNLPLHLAAGGISHEHTGILRLILETGQKAGLDIDTQNLSGMTPLHAAVAGDSILCAQILRACGARTDLADASGNTPVRHVRSLGMAKALSAQPRPSP